MGKFAAPRELKESELRDGRLEGDGRDKRVLIGINPPMR